MSGAMKHVIGKRPVIGSRWGVGALCLGLYVVACDKDDQPISEPDDGLSDIDPSRLPEPGAGGGSGGSTAGAAGATASSGGSATDAPPRGDAPFGGACDVDLDCVAGLSCFTALGTSTRGLTLVAGGYCSVPCAVSEDCASQGEGSFCREGLVDGPVAFCTLPCQGSAPEAEKCEGRSDLICFANPGATGGCNYYCNQDADCQAGRCDYASGQCLLELSPAVRTAIGTACEVEGAFTCEGFCAGDPDRRMLCLHGCRVGSICGGSDQNVCVPVLEGLRPGDQGLCERGCSSSSDCVEGLTECAATGFMLPSGQPRGGCWLTGAGGSLVAQRLSVEEMALPVVPAQAIAVRSRPSGGVLHELSAEADGVCVTGTFAGADDQLELIYLFGTGDGVPFDASAFSALRFTRTGPHDVLLDALQSNQPGVSHLRRFSAEIPVVAALAEGESSIELSAFAVDDESGPSLDPSQLEALRFRVLANAAEPFRVCVSGLVFE